MRLLTNAPGHRDSDTWRAVASFRAAPRGGIWALIGHALSLYRESRKYDCVVLGGGHRADSLYCVVAALVPLRRTPCVRIDCLWYMPRTRLQRQLKRWQLRLESRAVDAYVVWAKREIEAYARAFGLSPDRIFFIPYHHTLNRVALEPWDGGYVFSGGNFGRDYPTLIAAARGLPVEVRIACSRPELFRGLDVPPNVDIRGYTHEEFLKALAGCRLSVVALQGGLLHSGGQQTFLNSMALGKPTIVTDPEGAREYIEHGVTGLLVEPGNAPKLRQSILTLLQDGDAAAMMGRCAMEAGRRRTTEAHFQELVALIERRVLGKDGTPMRAPERPARA